eukprot:1736756-Rhodomonas_salina.1
MLAIQSLSSSAKSNSPSLSYAAIHASAPSPCCGTSLSVSSASRSSAWSVKLWAALALASLEKIRASTSSAVIA